MIDLHTHSTFSDGYYTPSELLEQALSLNLEALALTDHDAVSGFYELKNAAKNKKIEVIAGAELGVYYPRTEMEIIAIDIPQSSLSAFEEFQKKEIASREILARRRIELFNKRGFDISFEEVAFDSLNRRRMQIRRPHFAEILLNKGYIKTIDEAYKGIFAKGGSCYAQTRSEPAEKIISFIKENGARAILAHPIHTKRHGEKLFSLIKELKGYGLDGIEVFHSSHPIAARLEYLEIIRQLNLITTGGSDFHGGSAHPENILGSGQNNNLNIPFMVLDELRKNTPPSPAYYKELEKYISPANLDNTKLAS